MTRVYFWITPLLSVAMLAAIGTQRSAGQTNTGTSAEPTQEAEQETKQAAQSNANASNSSGESGQPTSSQSNQSGSAADSNAGNQPGSTNNSQSSAGAGSQPAGSANNNQSQRSSGQSQANQPARNNQSQTNAGAQQNSGNQTRDNQMRDNQNRDNQNRSDNWRNNSNFNIGVGIQFGAVNDRGIVVSTVQPNSLFYTSGIRQGDVIISVAGRPVRSHDEFIQFISLHRGERVPVIVYRGNRQETIYVVYDEPAANLQFNVGNQAGAALLGVTFDPRVQDAAVIVAVTPGGAAAQVGLKAGDHIVSLNGRTLNGFQNAIQVLAGMRAGEQVEIEFLQLQRTQAVLSDSGNVQSTAAVSGQVGTGENVQANYPPSGQTQAGQDQGNSIYPAQPSDGQYQPRNERRRLFPRIRN
jgi:PDZ domain-containing secreted protein